MKHFTIHTATDNIRATPPMSPWGVRRCIKRSVSNGATVVSYHEMQRRSLRRLLKKHPGWVSVQGRFGDRARSPIGFDSQEYRLVRKFTRQLSHARVGKLWVPSGNRYATVAILEHRPTGENVAFVGYHSIAHINNGGHFGWTSKGPKSLLRLRSKITNPAIQVYKQGMANLEDLIGELNVTLPVVVLGDWNFDAFADMKDPLSRSEPLAPYRTMLRAGVSTIYSEGALTHGSDGKRGIDYIGATSKFSSGTMTIRDAHTIPNLPSDHDLVVARIDVTVSA